MNYFVEELQTNQEVQRTAGIKARDDVADIVRSLGYAQIDIAVDGEKRKNISKIKKLGYHVSIRNLWKKKTKGLKKGDTLLIQFPVLNHSLLLGGVISSLQKRGVKVVLLIHDLETLRASFRTDTSKGEQFRLKHEEEDLMSLCDVIIAHNDAMKRALVNLGNDANKIHVLEIFDYLVPETTGYAHTDYDGPVIVAGNLRPHKAQYVYHLPETTNFRLYGVGYEAEAKNHVEYMGSFPPDDLPAAMDGRFGLVWDGESIETCSGVYGKYLRVNNPHKTSLYIASGLPVIIWSQAALADFVTSHQCGIVVDSLEDIPEVIQNLGPEEYAQIVRNTRELAAELRDGGMTRKALERV